MFTMCSMVLLRSEMSMGSVECEPSGWGIENRSLKKGDAKDNKLLRTRCRPPSDARRTTIAFGSFGVDSDMTVSLYG